MITRALPLMFAVACQAMPMDPALTGFAIWPDAGTRTGPTNLIVRSRLNEPARCEAQVSGDCPAPDGFLDDLADLPPRGRAIARSVECLTIDIACFPADADDRTPPSRVWSWEILPPLEEGGDEEDDVAFDGLG